jgi:hypothetical protein
MQFTGSSILIFKCIHVFNKYILFVLEQSLLLQSLIHFRYAVYDPTFNVHESTQCHKRILLPKNVESFRNSDCYAFFTQCA